VRGHPGRLVHNDEPVDVHGHHPTRPPTAPVRPG
jgi:hypothetical protein